MIVLRKTLDDDDVDEVFFCAEIECQKDTRRLAFYTLHIHFLFLTENIQALSLCSIFWNWRNINTQITSTRKLDYDKMLCNLNVNVFTV